MGSGVLMDLTEKFKSSEKVFEGNLLHVYKDTVELPNGQDGYREYIKHNGAVAIVPVTDNGKIIVEKQYRYPMGKVITEIPAGKLDSPDENHLEAAKRELREETGYSAKTWIEIGKFYPSVAYTTECIYLYLAKDLTLGERDLDEDEFLNVEEVELKSLVQDIMDGKIGDGKTIAAILKAEKLLQC